MIRDVRELVCCQLQLRSENEAHAQPAHAVKLVLDCVVRFNPISNYYYSYSQYC
jgi:hypothetical protein